MAEVPGTTIAKTARTIPQEDGDLEVQKRQERPPFIVLTWLAGLSSVSKVWLPRLKQLSGFYVLREMGM